MHAEAIAILTDLEKSLDTARLTYGDVSYWPLCRQKIWGALMQRMVLGAKNKDAAVVANTGPPLNAASGPVDVINIGSPQLGLIHADPAAAQVAVDRGALRPKALFFMRPEEYFDTVDGARFAKTVDSIVERAQARFPVGKIEIADPRTISFQRTLPSLFLQLDKTGQGALFDPPYKLENIDALLAAMAHGKSSVVLDPNALLTDMGKIFYFARIFERALTLLAPSALFQSVYYHPIGMAWVLACRRLGIRSVDVQHGRLGPHEGHYTQLTAAPPDGYDLVPDAIWCWGRQSKHDIEVDKNPACQRHGGIVGGNAWLARARRYPSTDMPDLAAFDTLSAGRKRILVSLQPLDAPLSPILMQAMAAGPTDWLWLLRLHPLRRHTAPAVVAILSQAGIKNVEMEFATTLPLFPLLARTDHHVTAFSSVAVEAAAFNVRTSLTGTEGLSIFAPQIARGICRYTSTVAELVDHVRNCLATPKASLDDDFIDMRPEAADEALDALLNPAGS